MRAGQTLVMAYTCTFDSKPGYDGDNTATVTWDKAAAHTANGSATATAPIATADWGVNRTNDTVTVTDSEYVFDPAWTIDVADGAQTRSYEITWNVAEDGTCADFTNIATVTGDDGFSASDDERIKACRGANVNIIDTTFSGAFERWNDWSVDKVAEEGPFRTDADGNVTVGYDVTVTPGAQTDKAWTGQGTVELHNPNEFVDIPVTLDVELTTGGDPVCVVSGTDEDAAADGFQTTIAAGTRVMLSYTCTFATKPFYTGTAVATVTWDPEIAGSTVGSDWDSAAVAEVSWDIAPKDDTVTVTDDHHTFDPGWVVDLADGESTRHYELTWNVGEAGTCQAFDNTASLTGDDGFTGSDAEQIEACRGADLTVTKNVVSSFDRSYLWDVTKTGPDGPVVADPTTGEATVTYEVVVTPPATPTAAGR
ncbi:hypothetical protein G7085_08600 [Tessaracoccus sp. HDW20]|uniref:hypothetical protein n=1 Tax=Tessaracoccus coleopterorum TaxID=2714950 RepID=UPI0018D32886|nr:hypothetical protein [Tessaracoccus coleopterorum]NHB84650.1 hypothetical protein [Tessaracoccus coleopterorum]